MNNEVLIWNVIHNRPATSEELEELDYNKKLFLNYYARLHKGIVWVDLDHRAKEFEIRKIKRNGRKIDRI